MKNLVIVMAGDGSLHEAYADGRDFELWVCYWGDDDAVAARFGRSCDRLFRLKGQKWALVRELGRRARQEGLRRLSAYDYVFLPDDDIAISGAEAMSRMFALAGAVNADIFQPAIANENFALGWEATRRVEGLTCRAVPVVEIMMPAFRGVVFEQCVLPLLHVGAHVTVGWAIEPQITRFAEAVLERPPRVFVLDGTPAIHTRPTGSGSSAYEVGLDELFLVPLADALKIRELGRFGSADEAAAFAFPATDDVVDWEIIADRMKRVREARLLQRRPGRRWLAASFRKKRDKLRRWYARRAAR